jgi:hypothetical protein
MTLGNSADLRIYGGFDQTIVSVGSFLTNIPGEAF